jgi:hypothetical protein
VEGRLSDEAVEDALITIFTAVYEVGYHWGTGVVYSYCIRASTSSLRLSMR